MSTTIVKGYEIKIEPPPTSDGQFQVTVSAAATGTLIKGFDAKTEAEIKASLGKMPIFADVKLDLGAMPAFGTKIVAKSETPVKTVPLDRKEITPQFIASLTPKDMEAMTPSDKKRLLSVVATMDPKQLTGKTLDNAVVIAAMDPKSGVDITTNSASELQTTLKANLFQHKAEVKSGPFEVPGQKPYVLDVKPDGSFTAVGVHVYNDAEAAAAGSSKETLMSGAFYNFCEKAYPGLDTAQVSTLIKGPLKKQYEAYMKGGDVTFPPSVDATPASEAKAPAQPKAETKAPLPPPKPEAKAEPKSAPAVKSPVAVKAPAAAPAPEYAQLLDKADAETKLGKACLAKGDKAGAEAHFKTATDFVAKAHEKKPAGDAAADKRYDASAGALNTGWGDLKAAQKSDAAAAEKAKKHSDNLRAATWNDPTNGIYWSAKTFKPGSKVEAKAKAAECDTAIRTIEESLKNNPNAGPTEVEQAKQRIAELKAFKARILIVGEAD